MVLSRLKTSKETLLFIAIFLAYELYTVFAFKIQIWAVSKPFWYEHLAGLLIYLVFLTFTKSSKKAFFIYAVPVGLLRFSLCYDVITWSILSDLNTYQGRSELIDLLLMAFVTVFLLSWLWFSLKEIHSARGRNTTIGILLIAALFFADTSARKAFAKIDKFKHWDPQYIVKNYGPTISLWERIDDAVRFRVNTPNKERVKDSLNELSKHRKQIEKNPKVESLPDIVIINAISLWDVWTNYPELSEKDPFDENFRKIYRDNGSKSALARYIGGGTFEPELEILCGMPYEWHKNFSVWPNKGSLPCLPRKLRELGYETVAFHSNSKNFYNRSAVYRKFGFNEFYSKETMNLRDIERFNIVRDKTFYGFSGRKISEIKEANKKPLFLYFMPTALSYPYTLYEEIQPKLLTVNTSSDVLSDYVNLLSYSTKRLANFIKRVKKKLPNSIIVLVGNHSPEFKGFDGFDGSGQMLNIEQMSEAHRVSFLKTPFIYQGVNVEPLDLTPLYEIPGLILNDIGHYDLAPPSVFYFRNPEPFAFGFQNYINKEGNNFIYCKGKNAKSDFCKSRERLLNAARALFLDQIFGQRYAEGLLE